jgi:hypothetical protein
MPDRPHRRSHLDLPNTLPEPLSLEQLHWLAGQAAEPARVTVPRTATHVTAGRCLDVPAYLNAVGLVEGRDYRVKHKKGTTWYNLRICPVHSDPNPNFECGICQSDDGALGAKCQHNADKTWRDFKAALGDPSRFYIGDPASCDLVCEVSAEPPKDLPTPETVTVLLERTVESVSPTIDLDEVLAFARCPMEHLWRYTAGLMPPTTCDTLIQDVVREGLFSFYSGNASSQLESIQTQWQSRLASWGITKGYAALERYARLRLEITLPFLTGQIKKPNGEMYKAPRMSETYRQLSEQKGLLGLRAEIDQLAGGAPIALTNEQSFADLYADTVEFALRFPRRTPSQILGVHTPFDVPLPDGTHLVGSVDLAVSGQDDLATLEFWDLAPTAQSYWHLRHDLRVIAALHAHSDRWPAGMDSVVVRYVRTGKTSEVFGRTIPPWTLAALVTACQATQRGMGVPRLAVSAWQCKGCPYWTECTSEGGWNILGAGSSSDQTQLLSIEKATQ